MWMALIWQQFRNNLKAFRELSLSCSSVDQYFPSGCYSNTYSNIPHWKTLWYWPVFPSLQPFLFSQRRASPGDRHCCGPLLCADLLAFMAPTSWLSVALSSKWALAHSDRLAHSLCLVLRENYYLRLFFELHLFRNDIFNITSCFHIHDYTINALEVFKIKPIQAYLKPFNNLCITF